jgi:Predicted membrane protein
MQTLTTTHLPTRVSPSRFRSTFLALVRTDSSTTATVARIALGATMLPHGLQKTVGWFGGYGFTNTMHWFTDSMNIPWIFGFAAIVAESLGALALLAGFATRIAALGVGAVFLTAVATIHYQFGFFMNWEGSQGGEGVEYFILGLALVTIVLIQGGGRLSVDRALSSPSGN